MNTEFKRMQELAGVKLQENYELDEAAAEDLELKSFAKQLYSYAKKNGAQAFMVNRSDFDNIKSLGNKIQDTTKPGVFIDLTKQRDGSGVLRIRMVGDGVAQLYKDMVNQFSKFEFYNYEYADKTAFMPYKDRIPVIEFNVKSKTTGKKGGVMATEALNEHYMAGGIVGVGAINQIPPREKSDYEMAFEHFMTEGEEKEEKKEISEDEIEEAGFEPNIGDGDEGFGDMNYRMEEGEEVEEAVGIPASAEAIAGEVKKMIKKYADDTDLGAAVRKKFSK